MAETKCGGVYVKHYLPCPKDELEMQLRMSRACSEELRAEVERLTAGIQQALNTPDARAYILEHTLKNGTDNCCGGRCQGHGTAEAVRP